MRTKFFRDAGMVTVEYAIGTLAAVVLSGVLLRVVGSDTVAALLTGVFRKALG